MDEKKYILPIWIIDLSGLCSMVAVLISFTCILLHLLNFRKPFEQRLIIRIQIIVPLFAVCCFISLIHPKIGKFIEPIREIYEAFVIYTFFSLLTDMLGGERKIIIRSSGRAPVAHPAPMRYICAPLDISDPFTFLSIKRGILQYVWIKPLLLLTVFISQIVGIYDVNDISWLSVYFWTGFIYNVSVTLSLYALAMFWKCLYRDLAPFQPVGKFLCVKLIIFASYWQGVLLAMLNFLGFFRNKDLENPENNAGIAIQNALLCVELIGFAIGHWLSFSYEPFKLENLPTGRLKFINALRDVFGVGDLIYDFRLTFYGDVYDYRNFDSVEATIAHPSSKSRMARIKQGLRYSNNGTQKYWLPTGDGRYTTKRSDSMDSSRASTKGLYSAASIRSSGSQEPSNSNHPLSFIELVEEEFVTEFVKEDFVGDEELYKEAKRLQDGDPNCPIVNEIASHFYENKIQRLRVEAMARQSDALNPSKHSGYGSVV